MTRPARATGAALRQRRRESIAHGVYTAAGVFFVVVCMLPVAIVMIIGLATGTAPTEAQGGVFGVADGYPAFNPQSWLLWIPAAAMIFLAIWTVPLPMRSRVGSGRAALANTSLVMFLISLSLGIAFEGAPGINNQGVFAALIMAVAFALFLLRAVAGLVRLVPRAWRETAVGEV
ncbi:hypothetical protein B0I08_108106 [Glaciihabitans tibetensis]|uniref:Uncharacterized protein n=1 Tax=Glaciihabitans tibetensis TaxID=1266600 RepID=A0A2T0VA15_9MICO|nr:hypothetical protein [Glaciihabitans tibetensis]PRY67022.1 hypothetical protein B0I08_108106 [Glaciihabitans tibetensis]